MTDLWAFVKKISKCILSDTLLKNLMLTCTLNAVYIKSMIKVRGKVWDYI